MDLPAPDGPTIADRLAAGDREADPREHRALGAVGERDALEREAFDPRQQRSAVERVAPRVALFGGLQALDERQRLAQALVGGLRLLAVVAGAHQQQHDRAERGRVAGAGE